MIYLLPLNLAIHFIISTLSFVTKSKSRQLASECQGHLRVVRFSDSLALGRASGLGNLTTHLPTIKCVGEKEEEQKCVGEGSDQMKLCSI